MVGQFWWALPKGVHERKFQKAKTGSSRSAPIQHRKAHPDLHDPLPRGLHNGGGPRTEPTPTWRPRTADGACTRPNGPHREAEPATNALRSPSLLHRAELSCTPALGSKDVSEGGGLGPKNLWTNNGPVRFFHHFSHDDHLGLGGGGDGGGGSYGSQPF